SLRFYPRTVLPRADLASGTAVITRSAIAFWGLPDTGSKATRIVPELDRALTDATDRRDAVPPFEAPGWNGLDVEWEVYKERTMARFGGFLDAYRLRRHEELIAAGAKPATGS